MRVRRLYPLYLFFFALIIRLTFLTAAYQDKDHVHYFEDVGIAINLLEGKGYVLNFTMLGHDVPLRSTAAKPPVYPLLVLLVFFTFGVKNFFALFTIHALLAAVTCVILYLSIAKFSHSKATIAALAFAVYPPFIYHSVSIPESTTLTIFLIPLFCYGLISLREGFSQKRWLLTSIISGLLALTEPVTVPFIFLSSLSVAYVRFGSLKKIFLQMSFVFLIFSFTIAPWSIRNYLVFQDFIFIKSSLGSSLKDSMYRSGIRLPKERYNSLVKEVQGMDEFQEDKTIKRELVSWIFANSVIYLQMLPHNFVNFWWEVDRYQNNRSATYVFGRKIPYALLLIFSMPSMICNLFHFVKNLSLKIVTDLNIYYNIMFILIFTYTGIYTVMGAWNLRYHFPVELAMFVFCAGTILYIIQKVQLPFNKALLKKHL